MKYFLWIFLFVAVSCNTSSHVSNTTLEGKLSQIPPEDRQKLEALFQRMMTSDYFACTLFGNKPMTFQEFYEDPWKLPAPAMFNPHCFFYLEEGWKTWLKYRKFFASKQFIFSKIPAKSGYEFLILINKVAFDKMFNQNRYLFQKVLGVEITAKKILQEFQAGEKTFEQVLNDHQGLVGIVLGYGKEASMSSYTDHALSTQILRKSMHPLAPPFETNKLSKGKQISYLLREQRYVRQGIQWHQLPTFDVLPVDDPYAELKKNKDASEFFTPTYQEQIAFIPPPNFCCLKNSEETVRLKKDYATATAIAKATFKKNSFVKGFLIQYCKEGDGDAQKNSHDALCGFIPKFIDLCRGKG